MAWSYNQIKDLIDNYILYKEIPSSITNEEVSEVLQALLDYIQQDVDNPFTYQPNVPDGVATAQNIGEIPQGTLVQNLRGLSISKMFDILLFRISPVYTAPSSVLFISPTTLLFEVGQVVDFNGAQVFSRGQIFQPWNNQVQDFRSGPATLYSVLFPTSGSSYIDQADQNFTYTYTFPTGKGLFRGKVTYAAGPQPVNANGDPYPAILPAGSILSNTITVEGVYPLFATSTLVGTKTKQALVSMVDTTSIEINLATESIGSTKQYFEVTQNFAGKAITNIQYYNTVSQSYDITNRLSDFTQTSIIETIQDIDVPYYLYTYNGLMRGQIKIKITLA